MKLGQGLDERPVHPDRKTGKPRACSHFALYVEPERGAHFNVHTVFQLTGNFRPQDALEQSERLSHEEHA